jgi:hypothetical protein
LERYQQKAYGLEHEGKLVGIVGDKLRISVSGKENEYRLAKDAQISIGGKTAKADRLKSLLGMTVRFYVSNDNPGTITAISDEKGTLFDIMPIR